MTHLIAIAAGIAVGANWQKIKKETSPYINKVGGVVGDLYAAVGQVIAEQKESFEDTLAEKKVKNRVKRTQKAHDSIFGEIAASMSKNGVDQKISQTKTVPK